MKNLRAKSLLIILMSVIGLNMCLAGTPKYKLSAENLKLISSNVYEFDIYLQHINTDEASFKYILGQYFFEFNPGIANGGTLSFSIIGSDLPQLLQPRNPTVSGNQLRLAVNSVPSKDNLPVVSVKSPGTLIAKVRLVTSAKSFSDAELNLRFRTGPENPYTKVFAYIDNQITDVTNKVEVAVDNTSIVREVSSLPKEFALQQNYPNPFNPTTSINYDLPVSSIVTLQIYDVSGREIATLVNEQQNAGIYNVQFHGSNIASGVYFYRIKAGEFTQVKKMFLIK
jgi:hypothetical protein